MADEQEQIASPSSDEVAPAPVPGESKFYLVWSPSGPTEPKQRHPTHREAAGAAWFMAKKNPGQLFYILQKAGRPAFVVPEATATPAIAEMTGATQ